MQPPARADRSTWLPHWIVNNNRTVIEATVSSFGYICDAWVNELFQGPLSPSEIVGRHVRDFISLNNAERVLKWIASAVTEKKISRGYIFLRLSVEHRRREIRVFPQDNNHALMYIIK